MPFLVDALVVPSNIVYDFTSNPPPSVEVSSIQPGVVFFYDNENPDPMPGSNQLTDSTTALINYNGNFHFLAAIPFATPTLNSGTNNTYSLVVGQNLSKDGNATVNCANLTLIFSNDEGGDSPAPPSNTVTRNCNAIPIDQNYVFNSFAISGLPSFNTVEIDVQTGQNVGIQNDVTVLIFGDASSLANPLIGVINSAGDNFTFYTGNVGNVFLMAFVEPTPGQAGGKTVVSFQSGDPKTDARITFDDAEFATEVVEESGGADIKQDSPDGSNNKGCLGVFALW